MTGLNEIALIGTGIGLGIVHVLTGPDHLSALATLSAVSDFCTSFFLGVRWGIGHSTGLLLVGIILILRDYHDDGEDPVDMPEWLGPFFESIVGFFMLFLGFYGFRRAWRKRHLYEGRIQIASSEEDMEDLENHDEVDKLQSHLRGTYHDDPLETLSDMVSDELAPQATTSLEMEPESTRCGKAQNCNSLFNLSRRFSARTMAIFVGIIHGLAGPGGVLGVIPAVQLHDWRLASLYLGSFCVASTITMGCFASCYGLLSSGLGRRTNLEFQIHCFSSSLSILVGITWLVLLSVGKLEDVFP